MKCGFYYDLGVVRLTEQEMTAAVEKVTCYSSQGREMPCGGCLGRPGGSMSKANCRRKSLAAVVSCKRLTRQSKQAEGFRLASLSNFHRLWGWRACPCWVGTILE